MNRKLFFGLFIFPLVIAIGMAVLLCGVVLLTHEEETPESLLAAIKTTSPGKRWQKAYELSNELNRALPEARDSAILRGIVQILDNPDQYDAKTRSYMALALGHFKKQEAVDVLKRGVLNPSEEVAVYSLWSLGVLGAKEAAPSILKCLESDKSEIRKTAAYVLGGLADTAYVPALSLLLKDSVSEVRWNAALALARLGNDAGRPVIHQMLDRNNFEVDASLTEEAVEGIMINAAKGLALIHKPDSIKILESVSREDKNLKVRQAALESLQSIGKNS